MTTAPGAAVDRVREALRAAGFSNAVRELDASTRTSAEAAAALGCTAAQIAKSIVFKAASGRAVLVIASGANRIDERKVEAALGERIGKADAAFVRERTGFAIGGVAPLAHATPHAVFALTPAELAAMSGGSRADVRLVPSGPAGVG